MIWGFGFREYVLVSRRYRIGYIGKVPIYNNE